MSKFLLSTKGVTALVLFSLIFTMPLGHAVAGQPKVMVQTKTLNTVTGTPVLLPRPTRLEKLDHQQAMNTPGQIEQMPMAAPAMITDCQVKSISGNEMVLTLTHTRSNLIQGRIYVGAYIYESRQNAANAGYKPAETQNNPGGTTDLTMVMYNTPFTAAYIEAFLIQNGKIITKAQFKFSFAWDGSSGKFLKRDTPPTNFSPQKAETVQVFCRDYAATAVRQYQMGMTHHLPGIVAPVWSSDSQGHYNWCLTVHKDLALKEDSRRAGHLKTHLPVDVLNDLTATNRLPALNPGRGP